MISETVNAFVNVYFHTLVNKNALSMYVCVCFIRSDKHLKINNCYKFRNSSKYGCLNTQMSRY